jgi:hypothetical protein
MTFAKDLTDTHTSSQSTGYQSMMPSSAEVTHVSGS